MVIAAESLASHKKVAFLIGGAQKGGTTALDSYLRGHPKITMAKNKEVHFFDDERQFRQPAPDYLSYHANFALVSPDAVMGEATPIYMYWHAAPGRVWEYNPAMKWILILRNPSERAYSHWNMERSRGQEQLPFYEAIKNEHARCKEVFPEQHRVYSYIGRGFYTGQIKRIRHYFAVEQMLILRSEDLLKQPQCTLNRVCDFLGVERFDAVLPQIVHSRPYHSALTAQEWTYLKDVYEAEILELERMLGWDCSEWLTGR